MCNLYSQTRAVEAVRRLFRVSSNRATNFEPKDAIFQVTPAPGLQAQRMASASSSSSPGASGLWRRHVGRIDKDGPPVEVGVFSFMTTTRNALVETVNHERMPVLFATAEMQEQWMEGGTTRRSRSANPIRRRRCA